MAAAWTFAQLAHDYKLKAFPTLAASTLNRRERHLALPIQRLGRLAARDVDPADIALLVEQVGARSGSTVKSAPRHPSPTIHRSGAFRRARPLPLYGNPRR